MPSTIPFSEYIKSKHADKASDMVLAQSNQHLRSEGISIFHGNIESLYASHRKTSYGGWMHPDDGIFVLVGPMGHEIFDEALAKAYVKPRYGIGLTPYPFAFGDGWIRFVYDSKRGSSGLSFEGLLKQVTKLKSGFWSSTINETEVLDMDLHTSGQSSISIQYDPGPRSEPMQKGSFYRFNDYERLRAFVKSKGIRL
jgi:hypothetical protein